MVTRFWRQVSDSVHELLHAKNHESSCEAVAGFCKEEFSKAVGVTTEKCIMAAIKVNFLYHLIITVENLYMQTIRIIYHLFEYSSPLYLQCSLDIRSF